MTPAIHQSSRRRWMRGSSPRMTSPGRPPAKNITPLASSPPVLRTLVRKPLMRREQHMENRYETLDPADGSCRRGACLRRRGGDADARANEGANRHRRRRSHVSLEEHHPERGELEGHTTPVAAGKAGGPGAT